MSIYVSCRCGQAFSARPELAGQTLACPMCQQPLVVPAASTPQLQPLAPNVASHPMASNDPFSSAPFANTTLPSAPGGALGSQFAPAPQPVRAAPTGEDSPLVVWLSIGGGGFAVLLIIGLLIYNATRQPSNRDATATASQPVLAPAISTPAAAMPPAVPAAIANPATQAIPQSATVPSVPPPAIEASPPMPAVAPMPGIGAGQAVTAPIVTAPVVNEPAGTGQAATAFTPPDHGKMVATPSGEFEVWFPGDPKVQRNESDLIKHSMMLHIDRSTGTVFTVVEMVCPVPLDLDTMDQFLQQQAAGNAQVQSQLGGQEIKGKPFKFNGMDALDYSPPPGQGPGGLQGHSFLVVRGNTVYTIGVASKNLAANKDVQPFLDSFRRKE